MRVRLQEDALPEPRLPSSRRRPLPRSSSFFFDFTFYRNAGHDLLD